MRASPLKCVPGGAVADRIRLPWQAGIRTGINFRAAIETLTNQQSGLLDIL